MFIEEIGKTPAPKKSIGALRGVGSSSIQVFHPGQASQLLPPTKQALHLSRLQPSIGKIASHMPIVGHCTKK
ncbi:MAG: hypothetical protein ACU0GG_05670 [Paracoccaceae bacterium]